MPKSRWALLCQGSAIDKYTNSLSIFEVIEGITVVLDAADAERAARADRIAVRLKGQLISLWGRSNADEPETFWLTFSIVTPKGQEHASLNGLSGDLSQHPRTRLIIGIQELPFEGAGTYTFNLVVGEKEGEPGTVMASVPLEVKIGAQISTEQPPPSEPTPAAALGSTSPPEPPRPSTRSRPAQRRRRSS